MRTRGRAWATVYAVAIGLLAGCTGTGADVDTGSGTEAEVGPIGEPFVLTLDEDESFVSVSPSGDLLVTATEPTIPEGEEEWFRELCIRTGPAYADTTCTDTAHYGVGTRAATWNADESRLAFVQPGSRNNQGVQDVVWVLDLASGTADPVTPEERVAHTPALAWADDGRLLYTRATQDRTELVARDVTDPDARPETVAGVDDMQVGALYLVDGVPWVTGTVTDETTALGAGLYVVPDDGGDVRAVLEHSIDETLVALSPDGTRAVVQGWDTHFAVPPEVHDLATGERTRINADDVQDTAVAAVAFGRDGHDRLVSVAYDGVGTSITLFDEHLGVVGERSMERAERTYYYDGADLTERGITLVSSRDGQPQQVLVFPLET